MNSLVALRIEQVYFYLTVSLLLGLGLLESTGYATTVDGAAFTAEISFKRIRFWLPLERKKRIIKPSSIVSVDTLPNGYTKIIVRNGIDLVVPTSARESVSLVNLLDALLSEVRSVELRRRPVASALRARKKAYEAN